MSTSDTSRTSPDLMPPLLEGQINSPETRVLPGNQGNDAGSEETVYQVLAIHQRREEWSHRDLLSFLQEWSVRFSVEFELDIAELALRVDVLPRSCLGHFRPGHNGFGLRSEIAINAIYLRQLTTWEILGVLLHELIHAWQYAHGTPSDGNHHNAEYRRKAESFGLNIGRRGSTGFSAFGKFRDLLGRHGMEMPEGEIPARERRVKGDSKMKKWTCGCGINIRCAVAELRAQCLTCGQLFNKGEVITGRS